MSRYYFLKQGRSLQRIQIEGDPPRKVDTLDIGPIEADCKINVSYDFGGIGSPTVLCHEQSTGNIFSYSYEGSSYKKSAILGNLGVEWQLQLCELHGPGFGPYIFGHYRSTNPADPNYQKIKLWPVRRFSQPVELGRIGIEWDLMLGEFNRNGIVDIVGRRTTTNTEGTTGDLHVWFIDSDSERGLHISHDRYSGNIGLEWNLQVADMNFDDRADLFGYNARGELWVWHNITDGDGPGRFNSGHSYGLLGPNWQQLQVTALKSTVGAVDILGIAASNGEVHGWFTNGTGIDGSGRSFGSAPGSTLLAGLPQTHLRT